MANLFNFDMTEEVICGHLVTAQMKRVWACQLRMVSKFAEVCERHNLKWFASGGTLLGAVRHQGYIPWDDDIDIHMLADDYERFCAVAPNELKPYFWQECRTEPGFWPWHGKIRDGSTTGCTKFELKNWPNTMNKGIFIDIFPLYYLPDEKARRWQTRKLYVIRHLIYLNEWRRRVELQHEEKSSFTSSLRKKLEYAIVNPFIKNTNLCALYLAQCSIQKSPTEYVGATSFDFNEPRFVWPAKNYREMVDLPFMGGTIKAPIEWDACLKQQYGDYMKIVKGGSMHSSILFDVDTPYVEKLQHAGDGK